MAEEEKSGSSLEKKLSGKTFGIPTWSIAVILAVILIGVLWYRNKLKSEEATSADASTTDATATDPNAIDPATGLSYADEASGGSSDPINSLLASDPTNSAYPVGLTAQGSPAPITNIQWSRLAFDELTAKGDDPTLVGNALAKFLAGTTLTAAEQGIVNIAEQTFGAPPEGLIPINDPGTPSTPVVPPPVVTNTLPAPSGFVITAETRSSTSVAFNSVSGADHYDVYQGSTVVASGNKSPIIIANLSPGTLHTFTMAAVDKQGKTGTMSHAFSGTTKK